MSASRDGPDGVGHTFGARRPDRGMSVGPPGAPGSWDKRDRVTAAPLNSYSPPRLRVTSTRRQFLPVVSTPRFFNSSTAASAYSVVYAPESGAEARMPWLVATSMVWAHRPSSITPAPSGDGQIRPLISFICHA